MPGRLPSNALIETAPASDLRAPVRLTRRGASDKPSVSFLNQATGTATHWLLLTAARLIAGTRQGRAADQIGNFIDLAIARKRASSRMPRKAGSATIRGIIGPRLARPSSSAVSACSREPSHANRQAR